MESGEMDCGKEGESKVASCVVAKIRFSIVLQSRLAATFLYLWIGTIIINTSLLMVEHCQPKEKSWTAQIQMLLNQGRKITALGYPFESSGLHSDTLRKSRNRSTTPVPMISSWCANFALIHRCRYVKSGEFPLVPRQIQFRAITPQCDVVVVPNSWKRESWMNHWFHNNYY